MWLKLVIIGIIFMILGGIVSSDDSISIDSVNVTAANANQRIVGGHEVFRNDYVPYQVSLQYHTNRGEDLHFCGGSIISPNRILTAAHCCNGMNSQRMSVLAGVLDLRAMDGQRSQVLSYDIHDKYEELVTSDIAILYIDPPLELDGIRLAAIRVNDATPVGGDVPVTLTGWGLRLPLPVPFLPPFLETINYPNVLKTMSYHTITNRQCRATGLSDVTETEICARGFARGACSGDSGGPLVTQTNTGLRQVGVVSYGLFICGVFGVPDVYTRVSAFKDWIQARM